MPERVAGRCIYCTQWTTSRKEIQPGGVVRRGDRQQVVLMPRRVPCCDACAAATRPSYRGLEKIKNDVRRRLWDRKQTRLF